MGPHFFKCGKLLDAGIGAKYKGRFNGAALFQVRKRDMHAGFYSELPRFNGAALFQVRKSAEIGRYEPKLLLASMGPHFFKCGKKGIEMARELSRDASMGPHFFKCGK